MGVASLVLTIEDAKKNKSKMIIHLPDNLPNPGRYIAIGKNWAEAVDKVSNGRIVGIGVLFDVEIPGALKTVANAASDVEEGAKFIFRTVGNFFTSFRIPAFREDKLITGTKEVNQADSDVEDLIQNVVDGIDDDDTVLVNRQPVQDTRGEDIVAIESARENFVKDRGIN